MIMNKIKFNEWHRHFKNPCGFTLVEMVIAIVLMGVIGTFSTQFITSITQSAQQTTVQKSLVDDAKLAMEYLIREVRVASEEINDVAFNSSASSADITLTNSMATRRTPTQLASFTPGPVRLRP